MNNTNLIQTLVFLVLAIATVLVIKNEKTEALVPQIQYEQNWEAEAPAPEILIPAEPEKIEPEWIDYPAVRKTNFPGKTLTDVENHLPAGHIYGDSDKITNSHEGVHGINSNLRQKYPGKACFYCLNDKAVLITSPKTTIRSVAKFVPNSLRGGVYNLYMVQQAGSWNDSPLYILDEWIAYTTGSVCRKELQISDRSETVQYTMEFNVYALTLAMTIQKEDPNYNDLQFKKFLIWNINRSLEVLSNEEGATSYLYKLRKNSDAESLRQFIKTYLDKETCQKLLNSPNMN